MEMTKTLRQSISPGEFAVSIELANVYLHVLIHPSSQKFLRFAINHDVFAFRALLFGLNISPWVFTRIRDAVVGSYR